MESSLETNMRAGLSASTMTRKMRCCRQACKSPTTRRVPFSTLAPANLSPARHTSRISIYTDLLRSMCFLCSASRSRPSLEKQRHLGGKMWMGIRRAGSLFKSIRPRTGGAPAAAAAWFGPREGGCGEEETSAGLLVLGCNTQKEGCDAMARGSKRARRI
jgi:hypothetical protein